MRFKEYFQTILEYNEAQMPKVFSALKKYTNPLTSVHFSNQSQVSFNPKPFHADPIGVYGFPKEYVEKGNLKKNSGFAKNPNIFILEPTDKAKILNLDMDEQTAKNILQSMDIPPDYYDDVGVNERSRGKTPGHIFWSTLEGWRHKNQITNNASWNALFKKSGYNTLYDPGKGIIHYNEPAQIVFLEPQTFRILDVIKNNQAGIISLLKKEFPDFKITNRTKKSGDTLYYYFQQPNSKRFFSIEVHKLNNEVSLSVCNNRKSYGYEGDSLTIVDDIKQMLERCEVDQYPELDYSKSPIQEIAKTYGFSIEEGSQEIKRNYKSKSDNYLLKLSIRYHAPTSYSPDSSLNIVLQRNSDSGGYFALGNYHYYNGIQNPKGSPEEMVDKLLEAVESHARGDSKLDDFDRSYKGKTALKDIEFLRNRVFVKRVK
jgi:hypothetical protein